MMPKIPVIIAARGGSRRLPRKNLMQLAGRTPVEWAIALAKNSRLVSGVWLTTDDEEIMEIGLRAGAHVIQETKRPDGDKRASANLAVSEAICAMQDAGQKFDAFINILSGATTWKPDDLDNAIRLYEMLNAKKLVPKYNGRECYIYKTGLNYTMQRVLYNKAYGYVSNGEQWCIWDVHIHARWTAHFPEADKAIDVMLEEHPESDSLCPLYYYPVEWWQQFDVDDQDSFELQEVLMKQYIFKRYGEDCYEQYGKRGKE